MHRFRRPRALSFWGETLHRNKRAARSCVRSRYNLVGWRKRFVRMRRAPIPRESFSSDVLCGRGDILALYRAVQCVDQRLNLDELAACSLGLVPVKGSGQHLRMRVPVLDHTLAGLHQDFESFTHLGTSACLVTPRPRSQSKAEGNWPLRKMTVGSSS